MLVVVVVIIVVFLVIVFFVFVFVVFLVFLVAAAAQLWWRWWTCTSERRASVRIALFFLPLQVLGEGLLDLLQALGPAERKQWGPKLNLLR